MKTVKLSHISLYRDYYLSVYTIIMRTFNINVRRYYYKTCMHASYNQAIVDETTISKLE